MPRAFPPVEQNDKTKRANAPRSPLSASLVESIAGFSAGVVSCLAAHPLDLLKNRLQLNTQSRSRPGDSYRILRNVIKDEGGVRALYRGLWPNLLGNSLGWGLYFLFYGNLKELFQSRRQKGEHLGSAEFFSASIIAGMLRNGTLMCLTDRLLGLLTGACTNPIWVVKTRMLERGANHPSAYKSMTFGLRHVYETRGLTGLWAGFLPSSLVYYMVQYNLAFMRI